MDKTDIELAGAVAKGTAEGVTAGLLKSFHELLTLIAGPASEEIGQHFRDRIRLYRLKNAVRLLEAVRDLHARLGIPVGEVHPKLLFPILEHASLEDDPTLARLWAGLLASASAGRTLPAYVDIASNSRRMTRNFCGPSMQPLSRAQPKSASSTPGHSYRSRCATYSFGM